ncbi:MAG: hypothetical protein GC159_17435 [Phycisphaera sp.]|nr:hypothetical protein [Phycisphaera sp.]
MPTDPKHPRPLDTTRLTPSQLVRLLNSTPLGTVISSSKVYRQRDAAGMRIATPGTNGKRIHLVRYVSWLVKHRPQAKTSTQSYEEKLRRDLDRQLMRSRAGRDIGSIPEVADPDRRERCRTSFRLYCETYFPAAFCLPWSEDHLRVIAKIERAVIEGGLFAFAMPRGSGKTTLARCAAMWAIFYGYRQYVCLIGSAEDQAKANLLAIKREMLGNDRLAADFPEILYPIRCLENNARKQIGQLCGGQPTYITWAADRLVLPTIHDSIASGGIITVAGLDSNIRGQFHTRMDGTIIRPSLVILDDPQTRQSAASPAQTKHRLSILNGDVLGMAGPNVKIAGFMPCTKIYHDDLADQVLDRQRNPEWQGECTKMVYAFPSTERAEKLWDRYAQLRAEGLREGDGGERATDFYAAHRDHMDEGAAVAWPDRHNGDELSALQHAMNLKLRDEEAFFAEYQNEPISGQTDENVLTPEQVVQRFNGRPRMIVPASASCVTMFVDVHDKLLYYAVCAWDEGFGGSVIDYGTYPDQRRRYFTMRDATRTLGTIHRGMNVEGAIQAGLEALLGEYLHRTWTRGNTTSLRIERCLVDAGYLPGVVSNVCVKLGGVLMASKGVGIRAGGKPMSTYRRRPGERHGHHWYVPNVSRTAELPHVRFDANYWKSFVHARLLTAPGDRGAVTLFGKGPDDHRLFAEHVVSSEMWVMTEGHGRVVQEWSARPSKPDNHWFDCLVGCAVAASMCGVKLGVEREDDRPRPIVKLSQLRKEGGR